MLVQSVTGQISHALKAEGADASEDGTGRGTPIICFSAKDYGADATLELNPTLRAGGHTSSHANAGVMPAICQTVALRGRDGGATAELGDDVAFALRSSSGGGDKPYVLAFDQYNYKTDNIAASLTSGQGTAQHNTVLTSAVRRLTPRECERLQGFQWQCSPDYPGAWADETGRYWSPDYTSISYGNISKAKLDADYIKYLARGNPKNMTRADVAGLASDGPRYKSLGNSWAVPKFHWLGARLDRALTAQTDPLALAIERYRAQRRVLAELLAAA
jgi:DNA (cytosine-5)-methyltransferase 1